MKLETGGDLNIGEEDRGLEERGGAETRRNRDAGGPRDRELRRRHQLVPGAAAGRHGSSGAERELISTRHLLHFGTPEGKLVS